MRTSRSGLEARAKCLLAAVKNGSKGCGRDSPTHVTIADGVRSGLTKNCGHNSRTEPASPFEAAGVAGEVSPVSVVAWTRPLEDFAAAFAAAGLALVGISEPHPSEQQRREDPWWDSNFTRPVFLLLTAQKL